MDKQRMDGNKPTDGWVARESGRKTNIAPREGDSSFPPSPFSEMLLRGCTFVPQARFTGRNETSLESVREKAKEKGAPRDGGG